VSHVPGPVNETKISLGMVTVTPPNELIVLVQYLFSSSYLMCLELRSSPNDSQQTRRSRCSASNTCHVTWNSIQRNTIQLQHELPLPKTNTKMMSSGNAAPTNATQAKERLYAQLAGSLGRMSRAVSQTADLCEQLQVDLHAMRIFAGLDAAK